MFNIIIVLYFLFVVIHPLNCQLIQDATSVIIDDVIYVLGGSNNGKTIPEILSIDLTTSFTIDSPPWSPSLEAPPLAFSSSGVVLGGFNNNFILVVGGDIQDPISQSRIIREQTLLEYDIQHNEWRKIEMEERQN